MTRNVQAILALLLPTLLCACSAPTPYTQLDWNGINESYPHRHHEVAQARTYVYREDRVSYRELSPAQVVPIPRPSPDWSMKPDTQPQAEYVSAGPIAGAPRFAWPVSGRIISNFGDTPSGGRNDGINIATRMNEPIHAAAAGTITYEGNELKGYGNLILIRHSDGYVTAYAHAARITVSRGDVVTKGQVIGYAGETGDVTSPQLHFEIRHDTQPVNPRPLLVASR